MYIGTRLDHALRRVRDQTGVSLAFGGPVSRAGAVLLERFAGHTVGALPGVTLAPGQGLGGLAAASSTVLVTNDYVSDADITHAYDRIIRAERLRAMVAAPVVVGGRAVAVVYGALRTSELAGERLQRALAAEVRAVEQDIVSAWARETAASDGDGAAYEGLRERVRAAHQQLRVLAAKVDDDVLRAQLIELTAQLCEAPDTPDDAGPSAMLPTLTRRETDVLALAATGITNAQIADVLGLTLNTAKGYMKTAMAKLGASSRLEAVVLSRRMRILP